MPVVKLLVPILTIIYVWGAWKFWRGFDRTHFQPSFTSRLGLTLLWPALIAVNKSYRQNFQKALRGR